MALVENPEQIEDRYMGYPRIDTAKPGELPVIRIDKSQRQPDMVPVNLGPVHNRRFSTAGMTPVTVGKVTEPPEWGDYYLVEWIQGLRHPFTLVKDFEARPEI